MVSTMHLETMFMKEGLKGVISDYLHHPKEETKEYITRKIKSSLSLFILWSDETNMPFIDVSETSNGWFVYVFSDENLANGFMQRKQQEGYAVSLQEIIGGKRRMEFFSYLNDSGANVLFLDQTFYQSLHEYIEPISYNGYSVDKKLRNSTLNALMLYLLQNTITGTNIPEEMEKRFAKLLIHSYFYLPTTLNVDMIYDESTPFEYIGYHDESGKPYLTAFTDFHQYEAIMKNEYTATVFDFYGLQRALRDCKAGYVVINYGTAHVAYEDIDFTRIIRLATED